MCAAQCLDASGELRVYCHPDRYQGLPNTLYPNRGDGTFEDVSAASGIGAHAGKGMSGPFADYDGDGFTDIFVANDTVPNFLFRNRGDGTPSRKSACARASRSMTLGGPSLAWAPISATTTGMDSRTS